MKKVLLLLMACPGFQLTGRGQCNVEAVAPLGHFHDPVVIHDRGGPAPFVVPVLVHLYYTNDLPPVSVMRIPVLLAEANEALRAMNADTTEVCSLFDQLVGDIGIELRLASIDPDGNCTNGIYYHEYDQSQGFEPAYAAYSMDTEHYLNIHVFTAVNSTAVIPGPNYPPPGSPGDCIVLSYYAALHRPRHLVHEVGHWAGLLHTFGTNTSGVTCGDDGIGDTPITKGSVQGVCDTTLSICTPGVVENVDNFMDYSDCGKMFTLEQVAHANAVMTDPSIPRLAHCTQANLTATGVYLPSTCVISPDFYTIVETLCGSTEVRPLPMCTGQMPDQLTWSFPGGTPSTSTDAEPVVSYSTNGTYTIALEACRNGDCNTVSHQLNITVNDANANGLLACSPMPCSEDFEGGVLPSSHLNEYSNHPITWTVTDQVGYASTHSAYLAPTTGPFGTDTFELIIGNFDMSAMQQPTIRFKLATPNYTWIRPAQLRIMVRDQCDPTLQQGWNTFTQFDMAGSNSSAGFVPTSDSQWVTLQETSYPWVNYASAEFRLCVAKQGGLPSPPFTDEGIWIDDVEVFDIAAPIGMDEPSSQNDLHVFPDPATDLVTIVPPQGDGKQSLSIADLQGRHMLDHMVSGRQELNVAGWPRGCYMVTLAGEGRVRQMRLVLQ